MIATRNKNKLDISKQQDNIDAVNEDEQEGLNDDENIGEELDEIEDDNDANHHHDAGFMLDGKKYETYQDMVNAKRKRNQNVLKELGFVDAQGASTSQFSNKKSKSSQRGIKKQKTKSTATIAPRRKSSRLKGEKTSHVALDYHVNWNTSYAVVSVEGGGTDNGDNEGTNAIDTTSEDKAEQAHYRDRLNDGSDLSIEQAVDFSMARWINEDSVDAAKEFHKELKHLQQPSTEMRQHKSSSPKSVVVNWCDEVKPKVENLSIENEDWVAKVTPERIYSVTAHPSESKLIVGAGDKLGHVGLWDVDSPENENNNGVTLFRPHSRPICCLEWSSPSAMVSASYDGTVRLFDVETGSFQQIFGTYDDSDSFYAEELGYGLDEGYNYWIQSVKLDHRHNSNRSNPCLFVSTSVGSVMHLDLRNPDKERITFHETLSEKKINTVSLHPNGYSLISSGLDGIVRLWDIRKFGVSRHLSSEVGTMPKPIATQTVGLSISSSYISPSGTSLVSTSFANRLDVVDNPHLMKGKFKPTHSIRHNNKTGRWLSTFMATWHPQLDIFIVGSMNQPRCMEVFDKNGTMLRSVEGEALTSVMSRCCFHSSTDKLILVGGNSSGRVAVIR